jgi:2,3,4,5-tetrahydropyridine-2-carboxylate N-succinyltransferase
MVSITAVHSGAAGAGLATIAADGAVLDVWFPRPQLAAQVNKVGTVELTSRSGAR